MAAFVTVLTLFTAFVLLDTFVIPSSVVAAAAPRPIPAAPATPPALAPLPTNLTPTSKPITYTDAYRAFSIAQYRVDNSTVYVANVVVADPTVLRVSFAYNVYGRNVVSTVSDMAAASGAILAINGAFYGARESSYVVLNGQVYRTNPIFASQQDLVIQKDGTLKIATEGDTTPAQLVAQGAETVLSFGPGLIDGGKVILGADNYNGNAGDESPRTAIAQVGPLHYLFVVVDGRTTVSTGLNLRQLADFFVQYGGVTTAYNLDGGGSSEMWLKGHNYLNQPTTDGKTIIEREVSDIFYV